MHVSRDCHRDNGFMSSKPSTPLPLLSVLLAVGMMGLVVFSINLMMLADSPAGAALNDALQVIGP